jgi:hypothetical protein
MATGEIIDDSARMDRLLHVARAYSDAVGIIDWFGDFS